MVATVHSYDEARSYIQDGDLIATRTPHSLFNRLTQLLTYKPYTHNGIAVWLDDGLWMGEINGGKNHMIPLSQLADEDFDVFYPPAGLDRAVIKKQVLEDMRVKVPYGFFATIVTGLVEFFRLGIYIKWRNILHCAGYSIRTYERAGWVPRHSFIVSPGKLTKKLKFKLAVRAAK